MLKPRKIASVYRKSDKLIVKNRDESSWIVSDTYSAFILSNHDYNDFISKYNSYKSTENVPLDADEYSLPQKNHNAPNFDNVIPNIELDLQLLETDLKIDWRKVFRSPDGEDLVLLDEKYTELIPDDWNYVTDEKADRIDIKPVLVEVGHRLKGIIMPVRTGDNSKPAEAIKGELNW